MATRAIAGARPARRRILVPVGHYLPGYRAGGSARSVANLIEALGADVSFFVVTLAWDLGSRERYPGVDAARWHRVGRGRVRYLTRSPRDLWQYLKLLRSGRWDAIYLNSFFDRQFSMLPMLLRWLGLLRCRDVIVAPRGEFSSGALGLKHLPKRIYCTVARVLRLYRGVRWHASTARESDDIARAGFGGTWGARLGRPEGRGGGIVVAVDLPGVGVDDTVGRVPKRPGSLAVVFVSRICRMKNLAACADILSRARGNVRLAVAGPIEDRAYWEECTARFGRLPANVVWEYLGELPPDEVAHLFAQSHLFLFPTLGENFGHVISEALSAGCPVLTTDQTPWLDLAPAGAGWALPLGHLDRFVATVGQMVGLDEPAFLEMSDAARKYIRCHPILAGAEAANRRLFSLITGENVHAGEG